MPTSLAADRSNPHDGGVQVAASPIRQVEAPDSPARAWRIQYAAGVLLSALLAIACGEATSPSATSDTLPDTTELPPETDVGGTPPDDVNGESDAIAPECDEVCQAQAIPPGDDCVGTADYFEQYSWPVVISKCVACHVVGGQAESSRYVLKPKEVPGYLALNQAIVAKAAELSAGGQPLLLLKPTESVPHGGQRVIALESAELAVLIETLKRVADPVVCPGDEPGPSALTDGVELKGAFETLHKASFQLVGRPPTDAEIAAADAGGVDALPAILAAQLKEPAFEERLREIFSDALLTDGFRANNTADNTGNIINDYYPTGAVDYWGGENWAWRSWPNGEGIRLVEALAREPVEFVVHAFRSGAPLSTILTAPYRLLNAYSARFFKVPSNTGYQRVGRHDGTQDAYLLLREQLKTLYGGMDGSFQGVKTRQTQPSTLTAAIVEHMALEVSCLATARDFDKPATERLLFPYVEPTLLPSGDPSAADQAPILKTLQRLHRRLLGERVDLNAPELLTSYALLTELQQKGAARVQAGQESDDLERPCSTDIDVATGVVSAGTTTDPTYVIRAWQGLLSYLLMDDHFVLEL